LANQVRKATCRRKDRIALKGDENAGRVPASVLDFDIPSGAGAGLVCVPFVTAKLFIAGAPWTKLAEIDIRESNIGFNGKSA
jgi:hypothetical protein